MVRITFRQIALIFAASIPCPAADVTGNWLAATPNGDGTMRRIWLHLKQQDGRITGTIRATQFVYTIAESSGGPDRFTITGVMSNEGRESRTTYEITAAGDELRVAQVRNRTPGTPIPAHRVAEGDGADAEPHAVTQVLKIHFHGSHHKC